MSWCYAIHFSHMLCLKNKNKSSFALRRVVTVGKFRFVAIEFVRKMIRQKIKKSVNITRSSFSDEKRRGRLFPSIKYGGTTLKGGGGGGSFIVVIVVVVFKMS